ncbi:unnamed protein product [Candidula unifasciata]|uniref:Uncharacterized protein n=1 Tax=Candidula unifasciata TaxID=100452 RepID=A0A8S3ZBZ8_9EUPU|nr:unnamed protein product [Candidula unifasciata]
MGSSCSRGIAENIREELWSYFALTGLLFLNIGIVMVVYALKRATPYPVVLEVFGLGLIIMGVLSTLTSWYVHRQHRQRKPICDCWSFCCKKPHNAASEDSLLAPQNKNRQNNVYITGKSLTYINTTKQTGNDPQHTMKMFSTPEFQKYAEYMERDTAGVEVNGTSKFKVESLRQKKHVHPQPLPGLSQAAILVNTVYTQRGDVVSQPVTVTSPIWLTLSK